MSADIYFCLCCLSNNDLSNLFGCDNVNNHAAMLKELFSVDVSQKEFENSYICQDCINKLQETVNFKHQVRETLTVLESNGLVHLSYVQDKVVVRNVSFESSDENQYETDDDYLKLLEDPLSPEKPKMKRIKTEKRSFQIKSENSPANPTIKKAVITPIKLEPLFKGKRENCSEVKPYSCDICESQFSTTAALRRHSATHSGLKPYKCTLCTKSFTISSDLTNHIRTHTKEKPYKCNMCEKSYSQSTHLNTHMRVHTGERPYQCTICFKTFATNYIKDHMIACSGQKPYECKICGKFFANRRYIGVHMKYHSGEKPHQCNICSKRFTTGRYLRSHMKLHNDDHLKSREERPYQCKWCEKKYFHRSHLLSHIMLHDGEKPYQCDICKRRFALKQVLTRHIINYNHEREKANLCTICNKTYAGKKCLKAHMLRVHSK